jgi:hypothetical protein
MLISQTNRSRIATVMAFVFALSISFFLWSNSMQQDSVEVLEWQARAGRSVSVTLSAKIFKIEAASGGIFGILKSPSITTGPTDAVWVTFTVTGSAGDAHQARGQVKVKLIKSELGAQREGDAVLLDLVEGKVCVAVRAGVEPKQ